MSQTNANIPNIADAKDSYKPMKVLTYDRMHAYDKHDDFTECPGGVYFFKREQRIIMHVNYICKWHIMKECQACFYDNGMDRFENNYNFVKSYHPLCLTCCCNTDRASTCVCLPESLTMLTTKNHIVCKEYICREHKIVKCADCITDDHLINKSIIMNNGFNTKHYMIMRHDILEYDTNKANDCTCISSADMSLNSAIRRIRVRMYVCKEHSKLQCRDCMIERPYEDPAMSQRFTSVKKVVCRRHTSMIDCPCTECAICKK